MTIEEYRAAILQALLDAKNEDGTPAITPREAQEALNGFTDDELQDGWMFFESDAHHQSCRRTRKGLSE